MLTVGDIVEALTPLLDDLVRPSDGVRVAGTASSALRGIALPVGDVDILAKDATVVDDLVAASGSPPATWLETRFGRQYLADHVLAGVTVQFSTVESHIQGRPEGPGVLTRPTRLRAARRG